VISISFAIAAIFTAQLAFFSAVEFSKEVCVSLDLVISPLLLGLGGGILEEVFCHMFKFPSD